MTALVSGVGGKVGEAGLYCPCGRHKGGGTAPRCVGFIGELESEEDLCGVLGVRTFRRHLKQMSHTSRRGADNASGCRTVRLCSNGKGQVGCYAVMVCGHYAPAFFYGLSCCRPAPSSVKLSRICTKTPIVYL